MTQPGIPSSGSLSGPTNRHLDRRYDVIIVGGGPAGTAAAITAVNAGLAVLLLERNRHPVRRPGETLHAGAEALFERLGIGEEVRSSSFRRFNGCHIETKTRSEFQELGNDRSGAWRGFQVQRDKLDGLLLDRARRQGVVIIAGVSAQSIIRDETGRIIGLVAGDERYACNWLVDASGYASWLRRQLSIPCERLSPTLIAQYGYSIGQPEDCDGNPRFLVEENGWSWIAPVSNETCAWVRLSTKSAQTRDKTPPAQLTACPRAGNARAADVSWRLLKSVSGPGYFIVGDASCIIDPASSHGVLKAMMTGMMAAHCIEKITKDNNTETTTTLGFHRWLQDAFKADAIKLLDLYNRIGVPTSEWPKDPTLKS